VATAQLIHLRRDGAEILGRGYGLFTTQPFSAGQRIVTFEGKAHRVVTRRHVESVWREPFRSWFTYRAWPLTDEVWVVWSPDPEDWTPIDHSCDPSCWLEGLDIVARRDLAAGVEITVDYATMYNEVMPDFECTCGADSCRGTIRGSDLMSDFVDRYHDHVSDYVRSRRDGRRS